jgi:hypothetical protein
MSGVAADLTDVLAGLTLLAGGVLTWRYGAGRLMALAGAAWVAGDAVPALLYAHRGPLVHLLATYPGARRRPAGAAGLVIAFAYVDGLVPALARSPGPTAVLCGAVVALVTVRWLRARGLERRSRAAAVPAALLVWATLAAAPAWAYALAVAVSACALAWDLRSGRWTRSAITGLVVDLGDEPRALEPALSRMLGDPGLRVAYRLDGWVDEAGRPVNLAQAPAVTYVDDDAAILHDRAALTDRALAESASAAVRLVVANVDARRGGGARP